MVASVEKEKEQLTKDEFIVRYEGAGRYIGRLMNHLKETVVPGFQGELTSLIKKFDERYDRKGELEKMQKKRGVQVLGGAIIKAYPELIANNEILYRLAKEEGIIVEDED